MKKLLQQSALLGILVALLPSCVSSSEPGPGPNSTWDHWNFASVRPRVGRFFLGYDSDTDGWYSDKLGSDLGDFRKTCQRVFLNHNPENPFQD